ncbi:Protein of unknown function [Pyronema omphalodes CBS 100304]|uniref:Uncharacterized protein n=1 Tax=Pyronema omphalodes (strain CBS 100304) TaxID=1076935 RepID=U4LDN7_PYROM|nr:Protein of unknown function [Pyronema omphalodes CBS 100304]
MRGIYTPGFYSIRVSQSPITSKASGDHKAPWDHVSQVSPGFGYLRSSNLESLQGIVLGSYCYIFLLHLRIRTDNSLCFCLDIQCRF